MSGPSDKARFYMEQAVPQLQEFKEKKIFTEVISSIKPAICVYPPQIWELLHCFAVPAQSTLQLLTILQDEIRTLVKKRSDFEHKVLARGSQPVDFARYAAWEISLEHLRQKRYKRLRIKGSSVHSGQA